MSICGTLEMISSEDSAPFSMKLVLMHCSIVNLLPLILSRHLGPVLIYDLGIQLKDKVADF